MKRVVAMLAAGLFNVHPGRVGAGPAETGPRPEVLFLYDLLHIDKTTLDPSLADPLAEMNALQNAYAELRDKAEKDPSPDRRSLKLFLFAGWVAKQTNAFDTIEAFNTDLNPIFESEPDAVLGVLKESGFLLVHTCMTLARHFFFEDVNPAGRSAFMRDHEGEMRKVLGDEGAGTCAAAFWSVQK